MPLIYRWKNTAYRRDHLYGRPCVVEARGRMNTVLVRFLDDRTPRKVTTSRWAVATRRGASRGDAGG
jgi:hypothetical protein